MKREGSFNGGSCTLVMVDVVCKHAVCFLSFYLLLAGVFALVNHCYTLALPTCWPLPLWLRPPDSLNLVLLRSCLAVDVRTMDQWSAYRHERCSTHWTMREVRTLLSAPRSPYSRMTSTKLKLPVSRLASEIRNLFI